jgi:hypothetical protein
MAIAAIGAQRFFIGGNTPDRSCQLGKGVLRRMKRFRVCKGTFYIRLSVPGKFKFLSPVELQTGSIVFQLDGSYWYITK